MREHEAEPAIGLAGGDAEQPAIGVERLDRVGDAVEQRLASSAPRCARVEGALVVLGHRAWSRVVGLGKQLRDRLDQAQPDDPPDRSRGRRIEAGAAAKLSSIAQADIDLAIDERAVAIEERRGGSCRIAASSARVARRPCASSASAADEARGLGLFWPSLRRAAPCVDLQREADDRAQHLLDLRRIGLGAGPSGLGARRRFLLEAEPRRAARRSSSSSIRAMPAFELDRDIVPGRHLVGAEAIPVGADIGVRAPRSEQAGRAVEMPGDAVAARDMEAAASHRRATTTGTCATRGPSGVAANSAPKPSSRDEAAHRLAVLPAEGRIGVHSVLAAAAAPLALAAPCGRALAWARACALFCSRLQRRAVVERPALPSARSKPSVVIEVSAKCAGSSALTSSLPPSG